MLIVNKDSTKYFAKKNSGGKGYNLYLMTKAGFNVPEWFVIPAKFFNDFLEKNNISENLQKIIHSPISEKEIESQIRELLINTDFPTGQKSFLENQYKSFNKNLIAVRSSALDEDGASHSFAGQLSSYLYIRTVEDYLNSIKLCWASGFSERSLIYRKENKLSTTNIQVSVVIQEMIDPDISGVMFTCNPVTNKNDEIMINSVYGVGEGLVSGLLEPDSYIISKEKFEVKEKEIAENKEKLIQDVENQNVKKVNVEEALVNCESLDEAKLKLLQDLSNRIEDYYQFPQDIEWAFKNNQFYLLQSRPVTTEQKNSKGILYIWDNSNIVESYGGITMPLTFGFARYVYNQVYVQFCEILMVPNKNIKKMNFFLQNMLGLFYGRVYYNLLNWYKLTSILPGYKFNRSFMETMMGTNESLGDEIAERIKPPSFHSGIGAGIRKFLVGFKFLYFHFNIQNIVDNFLKNFHLVYDRYRKVDYSKLRADQIYDRYQQLEREMLWQWHAPIINDFLCMVHFGIFTKLTSKWLSHLGDNFHNDLLAGNGKLESAEPTKELIRLSGYVVAKPDLKEFIFSYENNDLLEALNQSQFTEFYGKVQNYLDKYGFRCMSEMKLEQKDMHIEPSLFFVFLKNIINSGQTNLEEYEKRETAIREKAENELSKNISGLKGLIYKWSLKNARKAVMNRENTRFCRTRVYGVVRAMFYAIGKDYAARGIINHEDDIFYLSMEELKGSFEATNTIINLKEVIELRKSEYERYKQMDEPAPRFMTRGPVYYQNNHFPEPVVLDDDIELAENQIRGLGCSPGVVEGTVKVIMSPEDDLELNGEILVTHRTDPGWIPLYPSASGLLVERGGLLSHSAVVAREMGLPTIVSIKGLTKKLETGMKIRFNGETGIIDIL